MEIWYEKSNTSLSGTICGNYIKTGNYIFLSCLLYDHQAAVLLIACSYSIWPLDSTIYYWTVLGDAIKSSTVLIFFFFFRKVPFVPFRASLCWMMYVESLKSFCVHLQYQITTLFCVITSQLLVNLCMTTCFTWCKDTVSIIDLPDFLHLSVPKTETTAFTKANFCNSDWKCEI